MKTDAEILCPSCLTHLVRRRVAAGSFLECSSCQGAAVNLAVLRQFVDERIVSSLWRRVRESQIHAGRACPTCAKPLRPFSVTISGSEVELDGCLTCHALWFDGKELEQLKAEHSRVPSKSVTKPRTSSASAASPDFGVSHHFTVDTFDGLLLLVELFVDL